MHKFLLKGILGGLLIISTVWSNEHNESQIQETTTSHMSKLTNLYIWGTGGVGISATPAYLLLGNGCLSLNLSYKRQQFVTLRLSHLGEFFLPGLDSTHSNAIDLLYGFRRNFVGEETIGETTKYLSLSIGLSSIETTIGPGFLSTGRTNHYSGIGFPIEVQWFLVGHGGGIGLIADANINPLPIYGLSIALAFGRI